MMRIIPSLDLLNGSYVRLRQGDFGQVTTYGSDLLAAAAGFAAAGASLIHLVDLEGAKAGRPVQTEAILNLARSLPVPVQVGGGIRDEAAIETYLEGGVQRVVLGSAAVKNPELVRKAVERYGGRIVLGLDARGGRVATDGWTASSGMDHMELALRMKTMGVAEIVYTSIERDGMMSGPDLEGLARLAAETGLDIIASGGISSLEDLHAASAAGASGAILGRALHDGRIDLRQAIGLFEEK